MKYRTLVFAAALLAAGIDTAFAQSEQDAAVAPVLRASVTVHSDIVRIGDLVENAGTAAQIAIYRSPDLGTTGTLPAAQLLETLRNHQVIGVDAGTIREVSITRSSRTLASKDVELQIARALERRNGLGDAANLSITFDRDLRDLQLDASNSGDMRASSIRFDPRNGRFDITFEIANDANAAPTKLRFTGIAVETVEAAVLTRSVERNEVLKSSDLVVERRPKAEVGNDATTREKALGMQARKSLRAGQPLRGADLSKPDRVARDQTVTLIYQSPGLYLTGRGKALESGSEGDTVNVVNLQSKRTVQGTVIGSGQVSVSIAVPNIVTAAVSADTADQSSSPTASDTKKAE
ncbi:MAG: flagellar basal body P-ring formation protein FlgA [Rhizobiales bacterium]|nr:flagellar basal body P-ring formation protein FlgA [Hyphomicrobiales bacterium]